MDMQDIFDQPDGWSSAWSTVYKDDVRLTGVMRQTFTDFQVDEILPFRPDGHGQHVLLNVRKTNLNTLQVAEQLAEMAGVPLAAVGYAGLKDKRAVTTQWFSVDVGEYANVDWFNREGFEVLVISRHGKKLRRGSHSANQFNITLRDLSTVSPTQIVHRLEQIAEQGVPNYFGPQRFGYHQGQHGSNLLMAWQAAQSNKANKRFQRLPRHRKSLALSAARSWVFNQQLLHTIKNAGWLELQAQRETGGWPMLPLFTHSDELDGANLLAAIPERAEPLLVWLSKQRLNEQRRAAILQPEHFGWSLNNDSLELTFQLPRGSFATAVLRELGQFVSP